MPEFTVATVRCCRTNFQWEKNVISKDNTYTVRWEHLFGNAETQYGWTCTCEGYKFRKNCKHITQVENLRCGWNQELEPTLNANTDGSCPQCGGPTSVVRIAV